MAYTLNTGHALYGNLVELIGVQSGALVSHKTARTFTPHAEATFGSGTYGEHLRTVGGGYTVKGAGFSPAVSINTTANPNATLVVIVNKVAAAGGGGQRPLVSSQTPASGAFTVGLTSAGLPTALENWNTLKTTGTTDLDTAATPHMLAAVKIDETAHKLYVDGTFEVDSATRLAFNTTTGAFWNYLGGATGQGSVAADIVWAAWFNKALTEAELDDLYSSLGASNAFGLVGSSGASFDTSVTTALPSFSGSASVSPVTSFAVTAGLPVFSGSANAGAASFSFSTTLPLPSVSGSFTGDTSSGTISITDLRDLTTGNLRVSETGITVIVNNISTGALVALLTGQTSTAGGDMSLSHASIIAGTQYRVTVILPDGSEGTWKYTAA